ncbi:hypothetical protein AURDEDRAFT_111872, partial [Auricularia subglabra TFB-10046 SS5]
MSVSTISKDAPSQFAALLRRSKFASYDQKIGQVYTAYGGYAHRGDWGLKRPLPNKIRVRRPLISIGAVDSFNEQTEWDRRGPAARFVAQWNEMGMDQAKPDDGGIVPDNDAPIIDSDFARAPNESPFARAAGQRPSSRGPSQVPVPNIEKMRPAEFERYLDRLRKLRPKFKQFIIDVHDGDRNRVYVSNLSTKETRKPSDLHMHLESAVAIAHTLPDLFISQEASLSASGTRTAWIEQRPHPIGALSYTASGALQSHLLFPPAKGRLINNTQSPNTRTGAPPSTQYIAAISGIAATVEIHDNTVNVMDFGPYAREDSDQDKYRHREASSGVVPLRISRATVHRVPRVVGDHPEDLHERTGIDNVAAEPWTSRQIANPSIPGSPEWVAIEAKAEPGVQPKGRPLPLSAARPNVQPTEKKRVSANVLGMLNKVLVDVQKPAEEDGEEDGPM